MNGFGEGTVKRMIRGLGVGIIQPKDGGEDVIFSDNVTKGGAQGFNNLGEGDPVRFREYPEKINGKRFAEEVWRV